MWRPSSCLRSSALKAEGTRACSCCSLGWSSPESCSLSLAEAPPPKKSRLADTGSLPLLRFRFEGCESSSWSKSCGFDAGPEDGVCIRVAADDGFFANLVDLVSSRKGSIWPVPRVVCDKFLREQRRRTRTKKYPNSVWRRPSFLLRPITLSRVRHYLRTQSSSCHILTSHQCFRTHT